MSRALHLNSAQQWCARLCACVWQGHKCHSQFNCTAVRMPAFKLALALCDSVKRRWPTENDAQRLNRIFYEIIELQKDTEAKNDQTKEILFDYSNWNLLFCGNCVCYRETLQRCVLGICIDVQSARLCVYVACRTKRTKTLMQCVLVNDIIWKCFKCFSIYLNCVLCKANKFCVKLIFYDFLFEQKKKHNPINRFNAIIYRLFCLFNFFFW